MSLSNEAERLISSVAGTLPLIRTGLRPGQNSCKMRSQDTAVLFPGAPRGQGALAGLLLRLGCWEESHDVSQEIQSAEGSYWHGIVHRMEPDASNAVYWFRRVGQHAIFPALQRSATEIVEKSGPKHWRVKSTWDPFLFIDWYDEASENGGKPEAAAREIQMAEWQLLFDWCLGKEER